ncbi:RICIN domain-containing protein [Saccharothrix syringae]|uniref:Ricin B lectin domain-containing protein n=1 Tax=Saccharothrix syringae TaxID=103733 RepID=A0A5Q0H163_SACSY|nr:RICIN domain-containing protein [Saccharothrix syringae]QFZ20001.1 hypothetical protein EKG83_23545 [Saccharothrix syringae]
MRKTISAIALCAAAACVPGVAAASSAPSAPVSFGGSVARDAAWVGIRSLHGNGGQCLDADAAGGGNGTRVQVWDCNGEPQQRWFSTDDGYLVNGLFQDMCLDADTNGGGANGTRLQLWECNHSPQQRWWRLDGDLAIYNELYLNDHNTVVDRDPDAGNGAVAQLWEKNFQSQQWWEVFAA